MLAKTIHLVFNAHIDPVWLWSWSSGLDEILNTCESMCNLLDRHPDVIFTRGEAWVYEQVEKIDPKLFARIRQHIETGRWEIVGGWYVQPDCNLPGWEGMQKQVELGRDYFQARFATFPETAYNVDSFGHTAYLPELMAAAGQKNYVMMRPQEHEMQLPARLFRWRAKPGGAEIVTFRIADAYNAHNAKTELKPDFLNKCLSELPPNVNHTMCFVGVGDHGGGPTEAMIEWCVRIATSSLVRDWNFPRPRFFSRPSPRKKKSFHSSRENSRCTPLVATAFIARSRLVFAARNICSFRLGTQ